MVQDGVTAVREPPATNCRSGVAVKRREVIRVEVMLGLRLLDFRLDAHKILHASLPFIDGLYEE